ncbi:Uncharacterized protein conserved in bacteria [Serratia marcescens]|nr:Uncharacterized protein conserved in bacteria [Serratia marcescens]
MLPHCSKPCRARGHDLIGMDERQLPFSSVDLWTAFELS